MADALDGTGPVALPPDRPDVTVRRGVRGMRLRLHDEIIEESRSDGWFSLPHRRATELAGLFRRAVAISEASPPVVGLLRKRVIARMELGR